MKRSPSTPEVTGWWRTDSTNGPDLEIVLFFVRSPIEQDRDDLLEERPSICWAVCKCQLTQRGWQDSSKCEERSVSSFHPTLC